MTVTIENLRVENDSLCCTACASTLGPAALGFRALAGTYDLPLSHGQAAEVASASTTYVLRHYACPVCGSLFEVDMRPLDGAAAGEPPC